MSTKISDTCTEWQGSRFNTGYGRVLLQEDGKQRHLLAHRKVWEEAHGPIPEGLCVMHLCDNPPCVNLDHLVLGTHRANMHHRDAQGRGRSGPNRPSLLKVVAA